MAPSGWPAAATEVAHVAHMSVDSQIHELTRRFAQSHWRVRFLKS